MSVVDENIVGGAPTATREQAIAYLLAPGDRLLTPAEAAEIVDALIADGAALGIRWDVALSQIAHETRTFRFGGQVHPSQKNPAGIGATNDGAAGLAFPDWRTGIRAYYVHLCAWLDRLDLVDAAFGPDARALDPRIPLVEGVRAQKGAATTWRSLGGRWAVPGLDYGSGLARHHAALVATAAPAPQQEGTMGRVALAAGHRNTDGGNGFEAETTARLTPAIAAQCRALGLDVRVAQDGDGAGMFPGGIWDVARWVVRQAEGGWVPDVFLEVHTEGVSNPEVCGVFAIYPDWDGDLDVDVRDRLGPAIARAVAASCGMPVRGKGLMSERRTGVGLQGHRLGIFNKTEPLKASTTRLIVEYGAHSNPHEAHLHRTDAFCEGAARATAEAIAGFLGVRPPPAHRPVDEAPAHEEAGGGPEERPNYFPQTDKWVLEPFLSYWLANGGLEVFGYPVSPELGQPWAGGLERIQYFERARLERHADGTITRGLVGAELAALRDIPR